MSALRDVAAERLRQIEEKGYGTDHDDARDTGAIAVGAAHFALLPDDLDRLGVPVDSLWPRDELGPIPEPMPRRAELVRAGAMIVAEIDRLDRAAAVGVPQAYFPHALCWNGTTIQTAVAIRDDAIRLLERHPKLRAYSGLRPHDAGGDHRCGYAIDFVPLSFDDRPDVQAAYDDALALLRAGKVAYVEPLHDTWIPGNHHLHVSFKRCP